MTTPLTDPLTDIGDIGNIGRNIGSKSAALTMSLLLVCYRTLAPALLLFGATPSCCRFLPSCSEYAQEAVRRHGWKGFFLAAGRLLRCRPLLFTKPREQGIRLDPVSPRPNRGNRFEGVKGKPSEKGDAKSNMNNEMKKPT